MSIVDILLFHLYDLSKHTKKIIFKFKSYIIKMGNKVLGRRSRSFYKGFNERQVDYLKQKFETFSEKGMINKQKFMQCYKINENIWAKLTSQMDFDEDSNIDEYQFICMVHSLCSLSIEQLGSLFFRVLTKSKSNIKKDELLNFTKTCLQYNSYYQKTQTLDKKSIEKMNGQKFEKYDFDHNDSIDQKEFVQICLKDEDYKKWMFNMGFITKRQLDYQEDVYDLVDSDIADEIIRHDRENKQNISNIKMGIQHRIGDEQFELVEEVGEQSQAPKPKPWFKVSQKVKMKQQNLQAPNQSLQIEYVFGYRSFDCRNNVKFDNLGNIVYHQAAIGIVLEPQKNRQDFIIQHSDDITCLDVVDSTVVTGQTGAKPSLIVWQTTRAKGEDRLPKKMIISDELRNGISCVCLSATKKRLAAICNDSQHKLVVYDMDKLQKRQANPLLTDKGIIATGVTSTNIPFDLKFDPKQKYIVLATLRQLLFITFQKGILNANRGTYGNFTVTSPLCLLPLQCQYKGEVRNYMITGMGNGCIYFWEQEVCVKSIAGHHGSVSAICEQKGKKSFISGDKSGYIIIWNEKFQKQKGLSIPKSNSLSNMVVALSCNQRNQMLVGTKGSDIYVLKIGEQFQKAKSVMSGHNQGHLWALAVDYLQDYIYTGGEDRRLIKWQFRNRKRIQKQFKCSYPIRSIDVYCGESKTILLVGYKNGVIECFSGALQKLNIRFAQIKNPDQETLNLVKINNFGNMCIACYQYPKPKIVILNMADTSKTEMKRLCEIQVSSKVLAIDFSKDSNLIRFNTAKYEYIVYDISDVNNSKINAKQITDVSTIVSNHDWSTHTIPFSPQTQGILCEGVVEDDIICCDREKRYENIFVIGDKYSKIKLFNYPSKENKVYNKYVGHSNEVTGIKFVHKKVKDKKVEEVNKNEYVVSIGGEQKSIIIWKYNPQYIKNQWKLQKMQAHDELDIMDDKAKQKDQKLRGMFAAEQATGQRALATKPYLGQIKYPHDFKQKYNARRDNQLPKQSLSIHHVFGLRNMYIQDEVRNQVRFSSNFKEVVFPTACLGVKMNIQTKQQQFFNAHKQDIVSFAIDPTRKLLATGQMAENNPSNPRKKIVCIYIWDIEENKILNKLDGFHTIAVVLLSFSPNSKLLYSCGNDQKNTFAIYDWMSGKILYSGPTSRSKVNAITWKTDEQFMTCGMDHVKLWTGSKSMLGKIKNPAQAKSMFSCLSVKSVYITGGTDGVFNWYQNVSGDKIKAHNGKVHTLALSYDKKKVFSGGSDGLIMIWETKTNGQVNIPTQFFNTKQAFQSLLKSVTNIPSDQFGVLSIDFGRDNQLLVGTVGASIIYKKGNNVQVIQQGHYKGELWGLSTQIKRNEDNYFITGGDDKTIRIWDIKTKKEINRAYFQNGVRGLDWSPDGSRIVVADTKARIFLYNNSLSTQITKQPYVGQPYKVNANTKGQKNISPFVEDIKFSPDSKYIVYGCHGISKYMQILNASGGQLKCQSTFTHGSSALLHVDWSKNCQNIVINTQAYELLFFNQKGKQVSASSQIGQQWATYTRKFGFEVNGIFQGVDYSDINTVCRDPASSCLAVGYDDRCIRLFKYPAYIPKQVCKVYTGHSEHVTRVRFTSNYLVSLGGLDRTIIVWNVERPQPPQKKYDGEQSDGLDDLQEDVDLPNKAIVRKPKQKAVQQFFLVEDEGDEFMAIKPWLGAIKQPSTKDYPIQTKDAPKVQLKLEYVHGYRSKDCRQNIFYNDKQTIIYHAAAVLIYHDIERNQQTILDPHQDDILSIDYHQKSNQVITGELGPKPLVCLFKNAKLVSTFVAPVKKGVLSVAISPSGKKAACVGMDEDHHIAILDLENQKVLTVVKGTRKVITKIIWTSQSNLVTIGVGHYKYWTYQKSLSGRESPKKLNLVSVVYDQQTKKIFTGAAKGTVLIWTGSDAQLKPIQLNIESNKEGGQATPAGVVDSLLIQKNLLLAGTKDGYIFVIDKHKNDIKARIQMKSQANFDSLYPSVRAMALFNNKLLVGTLGGEIYQLTIQKDSLASIKPFLGCNNIVRSHYCPNNSWTNQVWGLHVHRDFVFTCSDDATVRCWSISQRRQLSCASNNTYFIQRSVQQLEKDPRTKDFSDAAKGRAICVSPDGNYVVVGSKDGTVRVFKFSQTSFQMKMIKMFKHASQWISDIKFGYNTLVIGSHDNGIYVYSFEDGAIKRKYPALRKHSSYITHMDISQDSCFLQSTCGAYELLFWDLNSGKQITAGASMLRDERWATWTCNLGWPVQGIYPPVTDGTYINSVDRSNSSIYSTSHKSDKKSPYLLATGNDNGKVCVHNYPCTIKGSKFVEGRGHSSHVTNVRWNYDDTYLISVGGEDQCLMYWRVTKNA